MNCGQRDQYVEKVDILNLNFMLTLTEPIKANKQLHAESHQHQPDYNGLPQLIREDSNNSCKD